MSKYTTLLFDADGTLLDFNESERQALIKTFQKYHLNYGNSLKMVLLTKKLFFIHVLLNFFKN